MADDDLVIEPYTETDDEACLDLERRSPQGGAFRLGFRRPTFRRRAETFDDHELLVARLDGRIVGVTGVAFKDVVLHGRPLRAAFYLDLRIDPALRRRGLATRLAGESARRASPRCDLGYCYAMDDNRAMEAMRRLFGCWTVGGYHYLVFPTYRTRAPRHPAVASTLSEVHERLLATAPAFEWYTDPRLGGSTAGHVASWHLDAAAGRAGCSAWDNRQILAEVVERLPWPLPLIGAASARGLLGWLPHPHIPRPGEVLQSWYLFDVHGSTPDLVVDLVRQVAAEARDAGIDFLYLPWVAGDEPWAAALRQEVPRLFAPVIPYRLMMGPPLAEPPALERFYVDVRDL